MLYRFTGKGAVWSSAKGKVVARFKKGIFETTDGVLASELQAAGYVCETVGDAAETGTETKSEAPKKKTAKKSSEVNG